MCSFGASDTGYYELVGTKGSLRVDNAYSYSDPVIMELMIGDKTTTKEFAKRDQFGPELTYFSECILENREPEPSGTEGLADVRIIEALLESAREGRSVSVKPVLKPYPDLRQEKHHRAVRPPTLFHASTPEGKRH